MYSLCVGGRGSENEGVVRSWPVGVGVIEMNDGVVVRGRRMKFVE
jgi:hypothetical protein